MFSGKLQGYMLSSASLSKFEFVRVALTYGLASAVAVMLVKRFKAASVKATLITLYFCLTLSVFFFVNAVFFSFMAGKAAADLRQSSVQTAKDVRILRLLRESNAAETNSDAFRTVTNDLEREINVLLPVANHYLTNRRLLVWRLNDWLCSPMDESFRRDLPAVVEYREFHPVAPNDGSFNTLMTKYRRPHNLADTAKPPPSTCLPNDQR